MPDRLDAMHAFVAVCDAEGFAAAARRLDLSPSAVTRLVAGLEERLGTRLLHRTTRSIRLTDSGARFLERARRVLADVEEAELAARDAQAPRGRLTVAAPLLFGRMHVRPLLSQFLATHPLVSAELLLSDRYVNLVEDGIDVAIRIGDLPDSGLIARRLGQTRRVLVATPGYLAAHGGAPRSPGDLAAHRLIAFRPMTQGRRWNFVRDRGEAVSVAITPSFSTDSGDAAIGHALADGGITPALEYQVASALRYGRLIEILADFASTPVPIQAVFPTSRLLSTTVRAFLDLATEVAPGVGLEPTTERLTAACSTN